MAIIMNGSHRMRLQAALIGLAIGITLGVTTFSVQAQDPHRGGARGNPHAGVDRDWRQHEMRNQRFWRGNHYRPEPHVIYAPPVVPYYQPQEYYSSPGFNLIFPLNLR